MRSAEYDAFAHGAAVVVMGGEDYHAVNHAADVSHHVLCAVVFVEDDRYVGFDFAWFFGYEGVDDFDEVWVVLLWAYDWGIGVELWLADEPGAVLQLFAPFGFGEFVGASEVGSWKDAKLGEGFELGSVDGE